MKLVKFGSALLAVLVCGMVQAASYNATRVEAKESSPKYRPTVAVAYEDSYHIAGASWTNDRAIASETEREPSSVPYVEQPMEPKPWLYKSEAEKAY